MIRRRVRPIEYFAEEPSFESLVLAFCRRGDTGRLVIDYAWDYEVRSRGTREFRLLEFTDVTRFHQASGTAQDEEEYTYQASPDSPRAHVVDEEKVEVRSNGRYRTSLSFSGLGEFVFEFSDLFVTCRNTTANELGEQRWEYRDSSSGRVVDFYRPFGEVCAEE